MQTSCRQCGATLAIRFFAGEPCLTCPHCPPPRAFTAAHTTPYRRPAIAGHSTPLPQDPRHAG